MNHHPLRTAALLCAVASGSSLEARDRPSGPPPVISRAEIRAVESGFAIYSLSPLPEAQPMPQTVSVGNSVRIDKAILTQPKMPTGDAVR